MARLILMREAQVDKYDKGDVVAVHEDGTPLGRFEDIDVWEAMGGNPAEFPATFYVVDLEGLSVADATAMLAIDDDATEPGKGQAKRRRKAGFLNVDVLERRANPARQTLFNRFKITRRWAEVSQHFKSKA